MAILMITRRWHAIWLMAALVSVAPLSDGYGSESGRADSLATLYNNLGVVKALNLALDDAKGCFDSALVLSPKDAAIYNNLGNYYLCYGSINEAIEWYTRAGHLESPDEKTLFNLGVALYVADSIDQSMETMTQFLDKMASAGEEQAFVSPLLEEMTGAKGAGKKVSKAEIKKLLKKAKAKRNAALKKKAAASKKSTTRKPDAKTAKSGSKKKDKKKTIPAGEKSMDSSDLASLLYWIIM